MFHFLHQFSIHKRRYYNLFSLLDSWVVVVAAASTSTASPTYKKQVAEEEVKILK